MKTYRIKWITYSIAGNDYHDALKRAQEFAKHNVDHLVVAVEESKPKRGLLGSFLFGA
jgi:hypothetical protein